MSGRKPKSKITKIDLTEFDELRTTTYQTYATTAREYYRKAEERKPKDDVFTLTAKNINKVVNESNGQLQDQDAALVLVKQNMVQSLETNEYASISIIFAQMALEAYIYEYAVRRLPQSLVDGYLKRGSLKSKWVVISQLITGKEFPTGGRGFKLLTELIRSRDGLVHHESKKTRDKKVKERMGQHYWVKKAKQGIQAVDEIVKTLGHIDPAEKKRLSYLTTPLSFDTLCITIRVHGDIMYVKWESPEND